jgi:phage-related protein
MKRPPRAITSRMERLIETALAPGRFVSYHATFSFVSELGAVEHQLAKLIRTAPAQAVALYETFLAACHEKAEEIDDSSGSFGQFVGDLHRGWIKARQAAGADPAETATRLLRWMEDDPYGFGSHLEKDAAKVLNKAGLLAFVKAIRERFAAAATAKPDQGESFTRNPDHARRRWGAILRTLYLEQKNVEAYREFAEATGLTPDDCRALATMLVTRREAERALSWVERGIDLLKKAPNSSMAGQDLAELKRDLLAKLGRGHEALEAAWAEYREHPSKYSYDDLMKYVPNAERAAWHEKAIEAAKGSDLHPLIELLLETKELERLAELLRRSRNEALENVSHYATEPAAKKLEKTHPDVAARLWCAQGMRAVNAKKSKYYGAALSTFERARRCFEMAGLPTGWQRVVEEVRSKHHRKTGFMTGFEEIVAGLGPSQKPSFLERAKARLGARQPGGRIGSRPARATRPNPVGATGKNIDEPRRTR